MDSDGSLSDTIVFFLLFPIPVHVSSKASLFLSSVCHVFYASLYGLPGFQCMPRNIDVFISHTSFCEPPLRLEPPLGRDSRRRLWWRAGTQSKTDAINCSI